MSEVRPNWIEQHCVNLVPIERQTIKSLGEEKASFFLCTANDCITINSAVMRAYPGETNYSVVLLTLWGLFKEACWFHSFLVSGNYPLLLRSLRFVWEAMFRAYFAEHYPMGPCGKWSAPGPSLDDKMAWLDEHGHQLNWDTCIEPVLRATTFKLYDREQEVRDHYNDLFKHLHRYAHPSAYLAGRMILDSDLHMIDSFNEGWAAETIDIGAKVFDLIWMAVFTHYPDAFELLEPLSGKYPILQGVFEAVKQQR